ncbi:CDP-diacylglycerol--serine O-phosphatidyltransferase [Trichoderma afarasin]
MPTNPQVKYDMLKRLRVADYITLSNVLAVFCAMRQSFFMAHLLIFLGYEFDRFDGIVARYRNECSEMGKQLDSFCDLVSFCVAPTVMVYCAGFNTLADQVILAFFVCSGVARLARFNVAAHLVPKSAHGKALFHEGLPTAYAALLISTAVAVAEWTGCLTDPGPGVTLAPDSWLAYHPIMVAMPVLSALMVSKRLKLYLDGASILLLLSSLLDMSLRSYLEAAYKEVRLSSEVALSPLQQLDCRLKKDAENLILVYGGSFNPPHRGHLDVLLSALHPVVNAAAVVVLPSENFHLRHKLATSHPEFFLSRRQRADLWASIPTVPKNKVWVWSETWYPFLPFTEAVRRLGEADGYDIVFAHLIGPDNLNKVDALNNLPYRLPRILVTNKARHVPSQFLPNGQPAKWKGFGEWSQVNADVSRNERAESAEEAVLWSCQSVDSIGLGKMGYYLEFTKKSVGPDLNSTSLRQDLLQKHSLDEEALSQLSTLDLLDMLRPILQVD